MSRPVSLAGVLDQRNLPFAEQAGEPLQVARLAVQVDRNHGARFHTDLLAGGVRIHEQGFGIDIGEAGHAAAARIACAVNGTSGPK